jgi:hypothetical protein
VQHPFPNAGPDGFFEVASAAQNTAILDSCDIKAAKEMMDCQRGLFLTQKRKEIVKNCSGKNN